MGKILLFTGASLLLLLLPISASANDLSADLSFTVVAADTGTGSFIVDTAYSSSVKLGNARYVQFFSEIEQYGNASLPNYTDDTFFVDFLTSADGDNWQVHQVDSLYAKGNAWSPLNLDADATVFGDKGRARLIYKAPTVSGDSLDNVRKAKLRLWYLLKGGSK